jgi:cell division protein FtsL
MAVPKVSAGDRVLWMAGGRAAETKPVRIKFNLLLGFTVLIFGLILGSLFYVWSRIQAIRIGYEISAALKEERGLSLANKRLRVEIATLKSYARIEKIASGELGMTKPRPQQVIVIR